MFRSYSAGSDQDTDSCDNCSFLVPKDVIERLPDGAPGSPTKDGKGRHGSPVLRTNQNILARDCPLHSDEDGDSPVGSFDSRRFGQTSTLTPTPPSLDSAVSSPLFPPPATHTHTLTYITTRQPSSPSAYSLLRRSCLRTFSSEKLPYGSTSGPVFFGDPVVGYSIAYIFRVPDPLARGQRRQYALIALGGRDSWKVSLAMVEITKVFESIANQIVAMADKVLEREMQRSRPSTASQSSPPLSSSGDSGSSRTLRPGSSPEKKRHDSAHTEPPVSPGARSITPVSSFLAAKQVDPDGYPRVSRELMRAKGLTEIVGKDNFFVDLHAKFVVILSELVRKFGTI